MYSPRDIRFRYTGSMLLDRVGKRGVKDVSSDTS